MNWVVLVLLLIVVGFILDREIYFYEGAHLGPRVQSWLYDRWARKYDAGKRASQLQDDEMLASPLLEKLNGISEPFILDFATGTGRLSFAVLNQPGFKGRIIALDISPGMLEQAAVKLDGFAGRVEFVCHKSMPLPFPDAVFDAVGCLEVLELLPDARSALLEMSRVLRPGGVLLTSRGTEESGRKRKVKSEAELTSMLKSSGFEEIQITKWWKLFDRVLARKSGGSSAVGVKSLTEVLKCSSCGQTSWTRSQNSLRCTSCGNELTVKESGIVLN
ncbi:MAG TPA: methyltransferase domain-containing protein [Anaerolineales bacterium]|nr:methyltransferase domain-containing protein [Anaerolineales bacterium]